MRCKMARKTEVLLDADNFCNGRLSELLRDGLEEIAGRIRDNQEDTGEGSITFKVSFAVDVQAGVVRASVGESKVAKPKAKSEGQIIRIGSGGPLVDLVEDEVGNRRLFELNKVGGE